MLEHVAVVGLAEVGEKLPSTMTGSEWLPADKPTSDVQREDLWKRLRPKDRRKAYANNGSIAYRSDSVKCRRTASDLICYVTEVVLRGRFPLLFADKPQGFMYGRIEVAILELHRSMTVDGFPVDLGWCESDGVGVGTWAGSSMMFMAVS